MSSHDLTIALLTIDMPEVIETTVQKKPQTPEAYQLLKTIENETRYQMESIPSHVGLMAKLLRMASRDEDTESLEQSDIEQLGYWLGDEMERLEDMIGENHIAKHQISAHIKNGGAE